MKRKRIKVKFKPSKKVSIVTSKTITGEIIRLINLDSEGVICNFR